MERCTTSDNLKIPSGSNAKKFYTVSFQNILPTCTCIAYAIGKNRSVSTRSNIKTSGPQNAWCKHIEAAYTADLVCTYRGDPLIPGICPECGGKTIPCNNAVGVSK